MLLLISCLFSPLPRFHCSPGAASGLPEHVYEVDAQHDGAAVDEQGEDQVSAGMNVLCCVLPLCLCLYISLSGKRHVLALVHLAPSPRSHIRSTFYLAYCTCACMCIASLHGYFSARTLCHAGSYGLASWRKNTLIRS